MVLSPWKVGIGATWQTPPICTGSYRWTPPSAPGITAGPIRGHEICCNQSQFPVHLAEFASVHWRDLAESASRINPNFPRTDKCNLYVIGNSDTYSACGKIWEGPNQIMTTAFFNSPLQRFPLTDLIPTFDGLLSA